MTTKTLPSTRQSSKSVDCAEKKKTTGSWQLSNDRTSPQIVCISDLRGGEGGGGGNACKRFAVPDLSRLTRAIKPVAV